MAVLVGEEDIENTKKKSYFTHFWRVESAELMLQEDEHPEKKPLNLVTKRLSGMFKREYHDKGGS